MEALLLQRVATRLMSAGPGVITSFDKFGSTAELMPESLEELVACVPEDRLTAVPPPWAVLQARWPPSSEDVGKHSAVVLGVAWQCLPLLGRAARAVVLRRPLRDATAAGAPAAFAAAEPSEAASALPEVPRTDAAAALLLVNPQAYTAWNLRKGAVVETLAAGLETDTETLLLARLQALTAELRLTDVVLGAAKKVPGDVWVHRRWLLARLQDTVAQALASGTPAPLAKACGAVTGAWLAWEVLTASRAAETYPRNYYAWSHRGAVLKAGAALAAAVARLAEGGADGAATAAFAEGWGVGIAPALAAAAPSSSIVPEDSCANASFAPLLEALSSPADGAAPRLHAGLAALLLADASLTARRVTGVASDYSAWSHRANVLGAVSGIAAPATARLCAALACLEREFVAHQAPRGGGTDTGRTWQRLQEAAGTAAASAAATIASLPPFSDPLASAVRCYGCSVLGLPAAASEAL